MDFRITFLHGDMKEKVYMTQPKIHIENGKESLVFELQRNLYGLKKSWVR